MPTGYTVAFTERDVTFREYALTCARAFGACIMQREESLSEPPKHREVSEYYQESIDHDMREIARFLSLSREQQIAEMDAAAEEDRRYRREARAAALALEVRLRATLGQVSAWQPPTPAHEKYKEFMIEQINSTLEFDCAPRDYRDPEKVTATSPEEHLAKLKSNLDYSIRSRDEERERCRAANAWIDALYASLPKE